MNNNFQRRNPVSNAHVEGDSVTVRFTAESKGSSAWFNGNNELRDTKEKI